MITITDLNGSKNFLLSTVIKKIIAYIILLILLVFAAGVLYIKFLGAKIDDLDSKIGELDGQITALNATKDGLEAQNKLLTQDIEDSKLEFQAIEGKIADLEHDLGLNSEEGDAIVDRIANVRQSSAQEIKEIAAQIASKTFTEAQKQAIFKHIPNGKVMKNYKLSDGYGWRKHPVLKRKKFHMGVDMSAPIKTPIYAPADGIVQFSGSGPSGYGNILEIRHNYGFTTRYAHLDDKKAVSVGDFVAKGELIAYSGNSGRSTGPHLHYEIRFLQIPLNPMHYMEWNEKTYNEIFTKEEDIPWQSLIKAIGIPDTDKPQ